MRKTKNKKQYLAVLLAAVSLAAGTGAQPARAANVPTPVSVAAETGERIGDSTCSLTLEIDGTGEYAQELRKVSFGARLYRMADIDAQGEYTVTEAFAELETELLEAAESGQWRDVISHAEAVAEGNESSDGQEPSGSGIAPDGQVQVENGQGVVRELSPGLYLVLADPAVSGSDTYRFLPLAAALPGWDAESGEWQYHVTVSLKPERESAYGSLRILKTLERYNASLGTVTFVFSVDGKDSLGNIVYSDVVSTTHSAAGTEEVLIENIPAGTTVTVTEVYSGASYELTSQPQQTVTVTAETVAQTEFSNTYNERLVPGSGAVNHFTGGEGGGWIWSRLDADPEREE